MKETLNITQVLFEHLSLSHKSRILNHHQQHQTEGKIAAAVHHKSDPDDILFFNPFYQKFALFTRE